MDISKRKQHEERLKYLSMHDSLTGLYNRTYFEEQLNQLNIDGKLPLSIVIGDVNGLKLVNDAFGHQQGDKLLIKMAGILKKVYRKEDMICRLGGDEFAIILPETCEKKAEGICKRIREACLQSDNEPIPLSISLGMATKKQVEQSMDDLFKEAEEKMYRKKLLDRQSSRSSIIASLQKTLQEKTHETEEHSRRLQKFAIMIGKAIEMSDSELDELKLLATLHDMGKIAIPDHILSKPGSLTSEEWEIIKKHPEVGHRIAQTTPELMSIAEKVLAHHERWDGKGYPQGLKEKKIPLAARILTIVDAYDVMTNGRPYKTPISKEEALKELIKCAGTQFDPKLVEVFVKLMSEQEDH